MGFLRIGPGGPCTLAADRVAQSRPGSLHYPQAGWWGSPGKWARWSVRGAVLPAGRVDSSPKKTKNLTSARHQHKTRQLTTTHAGTHQLEGERLFFTSLLSLFLCDRRRDPSRFLYLVKIWLFSLFLLSFFSRGSFWRWWSWNLRRGRNGDITSVRPTKCPRVLASFVVSACVKQQVRLLTQLFCLLFVEQ